MQRLLRLAYPARCVACGDLVEGDGGLCGPCWRDTPFITGLVCDHCGVPLPGDAADSIEHCDDCLTIARPWRHGRAALLYRGEGRKLVLALKHGDRLDLAGPASGWMARVARPLVSPDAVVVPVPVHWRRLLARRYNQAAVLGIALARRLDLPTRPGFLRRRRFTGTQDGRSLDDRFANASGSITAKKGAKAWLAGRPVLLVDDVMTSGATLAASADACLAAGAAHVCILALARVAKDT